MEYLKSWWSGLWKREHTPSLADDIHCRYLYQQSIARYREVVAMVAIPEYREVDGITDLYNEILALDALLDMQQPDGLVVPILVSSGESPYFANTVLADVYTEEAPEGPPRQAITIQMNSSCPSVVKGLDLPDMQDAYAFIWSLVDAGRFLHTNEELDLVTRNEFISMKMS